MINKGLRGDSDMRSERTGIDGGWRISEELWTRIEPLLPTQAPHPRGGRPWKSDRQLMDGIFYVLRTGCQWKAHPRELGAPAPSMTATNFGGRPVYSRGCGGRACRSTTPWRALIGNGNRWTGP